MWEKTSGREKAKEPHDGNSSDDALIPDAEASVLFSRAICNMHILYCTVIILGAYE